MPITVNPATFVISIPKSDTEFIETNATTGYEIRSYDEYALMRELADYLDSEAGATMPNAFNHGTNVTISGVVFARLLSFLAPYTITFENGAYQVKLIGGTNNNMLDVLNPNSVSVIPANTAGLQTVVSGSGVTEQDKLDIVSGTWAHVAEAGLSAEDLLRLIAAVLQGNASGLSSDTVAFKSLDGLKNRIEATVADGERTITSRDAT
jgi:hypothetical protein